jgi:hypothetical protein
MTIQLGGVDELIKRMDKLSKAAANKIGKKAITEGAKVMAKAIKREIPGKQKSARKAIGYSFRRPRSGKWKNIIFAKAGAGAGMKKEKRAKMNAAAKEKGRKKKKGVGIGVSNVMWLLAGTEERSTGSKRVGAHRAGVKNQRRLTGGKVKRTGRMKKSGIVQRAQSSAGGAVEAVIRGWLYKGIQKELGGR